MLHVQHQWKTTDTSYIMRNFVALHRLTNIIDDDVSPFPILVGDADIDETSVYFNVRVPDMSEIKVWDDDIVKQVLRICSILTAVRMRLIDVASSDFGLTKDGKVIVKSPEKLIVDVNAYRDGVQINEFVKLCEENMKATPTKLRAIRVIFEEKNNKLMTHRTLINLLSIVYKFRPINFPTASFHILNPTSSFRMMKISRLYRVMNNIYALCPTSSYTIPDLVDLAGSLICGKKNIDKSIVVKFIEDISAVSILGLTLFI